MLFALHHFHPQTTFSAAFDEQLGVYNERICCTLQYLLPACLHTRQS
jgi:hypothetical protein